MVRSIPIRTLVSAVVAGLVLLVAGSFVLLVNRQRRHTALLVEYEAARLANDLLEGYLSGLSASQLATDHRVRSFGVYASDGTALVRLGPAPEPLHPPPNARSSGAIERDGNVVRYTRMIGRMGQREPGGRRAMGRGAGPQPHQWVLAEINVGDLLQEQRLFTALFLFYAAIVAGFGTALYLLARRLGAYREREAAQQRLVQLGEAARTLSHEIKNPLGAIRVQQAILARRLPAEHAGSLTVIAEETERIAALTDRVREFLMDPKGLPEQVDAAAVARGVAERMDHPIAVDSPQSPVLIEFDPGRFRSVVENVLRNAVEASPGEEAVAATLSVRHGVVQLDVCDRGPGVPAHLRERVFDPFFTTKDRGSGVGLAIVRSFVEAAGGTVQILDGKPRGTIMRLTFPMPHGDKETADADPGSG